MAGPIEAEQEVGACNSEDLRVEEPSRKGKHSPWISAVVAEVPCGATRWRRGVRPCWDRSEGRLPDDSRCRSSLWLPSLWCEYSVGLGRSRAGWCRAEGTVRADGGGRRLRGLRVQGRAEHPLRFDPGDSRAVHRGRCLGRRPGGRVQPGDAARPCTDRRRRDGDAPAADGGGIAGGEPARRPVGGCAAQGTGAARGLSRRRRGRARR